MTHTHTGAGGLKCSEQYAYTYDAGDRLVKVQHTLDGNKVELAEYGYDDLGRLTTKSLHGGKADKLSYEYNIRDWLIKIAGGKFTEYLGYQDRRLNVSPCYSENISYLAWKGGISGGTHQYDFLYDSRNRMISASYNNITLLFTSLPGYRVAVSQYDWNGNILELEHYGKISGSKFGLINDLSFIYSGNRLSGVIDQVNPVTPSDPTEIQRLTFAYDANGNLTKDLNKNISNIQYNFLNLKKIGCASTKVNKSKLLLPFVFGLHYLCPAKSHSVTAVPSPTHTPLTARNCARCISQAVRPPPRTIAAT